VVSSAVTVGRETDEGLVKSTVRWKPALRMMLSRVGYLVVMLVRREVSAWLTSMGCIGGCCWKGDLGRLPLDPVAHVVEVGDVVGLASYLGGAMLGDEGVKPVFAATDGDNEDSAGDHALGESFADARRGTSDEHGLVWERHSPGVMRWVVIWMSDSITLSNHGSRARCKVSEHIFMRAVACVVVAGSLPQSGTVGWCKRGVQSGFPACKLGGLGATPQR